MIRFYGIHISRNTLWRNKFHTSNKLVRQDIKGPADGAQSFFARGTSKYN